MPNGLYTAFWSQRMREADAKNESGRRAASGLLGRLARDKRGNTLAMMAALLIPLIGMVGSGVDMARPRRPRTALSRPGHRSHSAGQAFTAGR